MEKPIISFEVVIKSTCALFYIRRYDEFYARLYGLCKFRYIKGSDIINAFWDCDLTRFCTLISKELALDDEIKNFINKSLLNSINIHSDFKAGESVSFIRFELTKNQIYYLNRKFKQARKEMLY